MQIGNLCLWAVIEGIAVKQIFSKNRLFQKEEAKKRFTKNKEKICLGIFVLVAMLSGWIVGGSVQSILDCIKLLTVFVVFSMAALTDIESYIIPNSLVLAIVGVRSVLVLAEFFGAKDNCAYQIKVSLVGGILSLVIFLIISIITKGGFGMGDVKLLAAQGFMMGLYSVVNTFLYALVCCSIIALVLVAANKKKLKDKMPFAPFIFVGYVVSLMIGS